MKKSKVVVPALGLIALGVAASVTGTVAWFTANTTIKVHGMEVHTKVSSNLQVAETNADANYRTDDLSQPRSGRLEPVSSVDGESFFYHANNNLDGNGKPTDAAYVQYSEAAVEDPSNAINDTGAKKTHYDAAFQTRYSVTAPITTSNVVYGYIDYDFYLKATSTEDNSKLALTTINLMYDDAAIAGSEKAWRVAVFQEKVDQNAAGTSLSRVSILTLAGAANYTTGQAVASTTALGAVTYNEPAFIDSDLDAGATQRYRIRVRLWLEGEDSTCNNETYANLNEDWKLELRFDLGTLAAGATNITTNTTIFA